MASLCGDLPAKRRCLSESQLFEHDELISSASGAHLAFKEAHEEALQNIEPARI